MSAFQGNGTGVAGTSFPQVALGTCGLEGAEGLQIPVGALFFLAMAGSLRGVPEAEPSSEVVMCLGVEKHF